MYIYQNFKSLNETSLYYILSKGSSLSQVEIKTGPVQFGPWGPFFEPVLIIRIVKCVELIEYYMSVKNHVDRIAIAM